MIFYAVTKGKYSDYHIITITTDKEKAEFLAKKFSDKWDEAKVEEYEENENLFKPLWKVNFDVGGSVTEVFDVSNSEWHFYNTTNRVWYIMESLGTSVTVTADDRESAIKIAAEKRAEFLAREEGIA